MTSQSVASQAQAARGLTLQRENAGAEAPASLLHRALEHQQAGRAQDAFILLEQILNDDPTHHQALNLMGVLAMGLGDTTLAGDLFQRAVHASPKTPLYHCNLGKVLHEQKDFEAAVNCFRHALTLEPGMAQTHYDLAVVLEKQGQAASAIHHYQQALKFKPGFVEALRGLGIAQQNQERVEEALACYKKAITFNPHYAEAHYSLAHAYDEQGQRELAIQSYVRAIQCHGAYYDAYVNLGRLLYEEGRFDEAAQVYQTAIRLDPAQAEPYINLSALLRDVGQHHEAVGLLKNALAVCPDSAGIYNNLGATLATQGLIDETIDAYQKSISLNPDNAWTWSNLLLTLQYVQEISAEKIFSWHLRFAEQFETPLQPLWQPHLNSRDPERRLKVGYVSGDFRKHPAAYFFEPVLRGHDKAQVESYCYYAFHVVDEMTESYRALADHWLDCTRMSDDALAKRIREDGIDILVDLSGHTSHNRLLTFARKPAPVQVTWIGYAGTTGLTALDYRLTDVHMDPPGQTERYHSEKLIRLPHATTYQPPAGCPEVNELPAWAQGWVTFASLNAPKKINPRVANLWGRILNSLPQSRLILGGVTSRETHDRLLGFFQQAGVDPSRLILQPTLALLDYMALHHQIDLALDPFPYNGGTTTMHALWMGVPVVSLEGESPVSRGGATILSRVGLSDFVTQTEDAYFQRVMDVVSDLDGLGALRQSLRSRMLNADNDGHAVVRDLENAYRAMWRTWCASGE